MRKKKAKGYRPVRRTKWVTLELEAEDGYEPLQAEIVTSLTFGELEALAFSGDSTNETVWKGMARYVLQWNVLAETEAGEWEALPPPAEGGWEVFKATEAIVTLWLLKELRTGYLGGDALPKGPRRTSDTPATPNASEATSSPPISA